MNFLNKNRELEMMICMKEQGYSTTLDGKTISFSVECMMDMWDILIKEKEKKGLG